MTKDSIRFVIFIGFGAFIIIMTLYFILHKQIEEVEERFIPLEEQITNYNTSLDDANKRIDTLQGELQKIKSDKTEKKADAKDCNDIAIKNAQEYMINNFELDKNAAIEAGSVLDPNYIINTQKRIDEGYYGIEQYNSYYSDCMREKGYESN